MPADGRRWGRCRHWLLTRILQGHTKDRRPMTGNESISFYVFYVIFVVNRLIYCRSQRLSLFLKAGCATKIAKAPVLCG